MMQDSVGTDPVAEDPAEKQRRDNQEQAPKQPHVDRVSSNGLGECDQGIQLKEERDRITLEISKVSDKDEKQEQTEKENLGNATRIAECEELFHHREIPGRNGTGRKLTGGDCFLMAAMPKKFCSI